MNLRIVRFRITDNSYEVLVTNLERDDFEVKELKEVYNLRWSIETSFRHLKYGLA